MTNLPLTGAWHEAVISVRDLDKWCAALTHLFGWSEVSRGSVDARLLRSWHLASGITVEERVLGNTDDNARQVRLIKFNGAEQVQIRSSAMGWDTGGVFSLLCYARDTDTTFRAAQELGWSAYNDPVDMHFEGRTLRNVVLRAWDGVNFGLYCPKTPPPPSPPRYAKASAPFNGQQMVRAIKPARDFYANVLGWTPWFEGTLRLNCNNFGMPENYVGVLPKNVAIAAGGKDAANAWAYAQVELVQWDGFSGRDLAARAVPPNLGILALRIPVADARAHAHSIIQRGGQLWSTPTTIALAPYGESIIFSVRTPDGVMIEFFSLT